MTRKKSRASWRLVLDLLTIAFGMVLGSLGWCTFMLPHHITIGGLPGISSLVFWSVGIPVQYTYFTLNAILLVAALVILGWKFCFRTIFAVCIFTLMTSVLQSGGVQPLFADQPFLACLIGGLLMGVGMGLALMCNASSGGSDVIAAMVHKYRDISLGRVILICDLTIVTSSYLIIGSWEKVIYGYIVLFVMSACVDYVVNGRRGSVQFFVISDQWEKIGRAINDEIDRGCTLIDAHGFYTGKPVGMLFIIARRTQRRDIFRVIDEIDPHAFVSQSSVSAVYGMGFDRMKFKSKEVKK